MKKIIINLEKYIGSMKTGLIFIGLLTVLLMISSFLESYTSTAYVDRLIYSSIWFKVLMGLICFIIIFSLLRRFPVKRKFMGFYLIHISLIMILAGGFLTSYTGVDGSIVLYPNQTSNEIELSNQQLVLYQGENEKNLHAFKRFKLPYSSQREKIGQMVFPGLIINQYLPFALLKGVLGEQKSKEKHYSVILVVKDGRHQSELILTNHPDSMFGSRGTIGNINFTLLPKVMLKCFEEKMSYDFFFWDRKKQECFMPPQKYFKVGKSKLGNRFIDYNYQKNKYKFWPEMSPRPMRGHGNVLENAPVMVLSKRVFKNKNDILLFAGELYFWSDKEKKFVKKVLTDNWINISSKMHVRKKVDSEFRPIVKSPDPVIPRNGQKSISAIQIEYQGQNIWVTENKPLTLKTKDKLIAVSLEREKVHLPFKLVLNRFKMDFYPNSSMPSTYQSFVSIDQDEVIHKIAMNQPLNYRGFRLFQSSYFEIGREEYASILSVARDPGRTLKYLGSFLLLIGCVYYYLRRLGKN